jgi:two-component system chemotaxis sensor kinase CheA
MAAGFSTAAQVSDLSGRGVGMDVVKTNIAKLNGTVELESKFGQGTTVTIKIPLTVAIMPAMMVDISGELYAVPLGNIHEIVRPETEEINTINGQQVMQLRDSVLPLVNMANQLHATGREDPPRFAVVVSQGEEKLALMVHALIGQQEVVIKPLDECFEDSTSVSGATVRDDGGVSLIVDIAGLFQDIKHAA